MIRTYWVWRRELAVMLRAPILYLVGGLFLVVQGVAFAGLVGALSDPRRPAPLGALLEGQLAGTLLTWVLELVVLTLLGMRTIADDKRDGAWELLLTAGVGEGAAVTGKWLAAVTIYAAVWLPTVAYLALIAIYRGDAGGWDVPAIAVGYAGAIGLGAALLAWSVAASAATASALAAGALGFAWLIGLFLVGELPALWPELAVDHPALAGVLDAVSLRAIATDFARGHVALRALVVLAGVTAVGLALAIALGCAGRRRRGELRIRALGTAVVAAIAILAGVLAARHPAGLDLSAAHRSSLDPDTRAVLAELPGPARLTIVEPTYGALEPIYDEVARVAGQMADAAPGLTVRRVDPAMAPGGLAAIAHAAGLVPANFAAGGSIVVELGGKQQVVDLLAFAAIDSGPDGAPIVEQLAIEQALAGALAALSAVRPVTVCATRGHGELPLAATPSNRDWSAVAQRLRGAGMTTRELELTAAVPADCAVVIVAGPAAPFTAGEALAIQRFVRGGGGLVVAAEVNPLTSALPPTGLEAVLGAEGLGLPAAIAIDPSLAPREVPGALYITSGYADHPINRGFAGARPSLWFQPRVVVATGGARPLISATPASWGERNFRDPPARDADDLAGPVAVAAIGSSHRVIAIGSAESLTTELLTASPSAIELWLTRAIRFASGAPEPTVAIARRAPDQVRLIMTPGQRRAVIALSVAGIPLAWILLGGAVVWWRRRRAR
ncbi:MAG TPA: Gldg family protein [Kofleriaceae bacterium]|nr:Gldg family protein [Kofleriaceae bacterium]